MAVLAAPGRNAWLDVLRRWCLLGQEPVVAGDARPRTLSAARQFRAAARRAGGRRRPLRADRRRLGTVQTGSTALPESVHDDSRTDRPAPHSGDPRRRPHLRSDRRWNAGAGEKPPLPRDRSPCDQANARRHAQVAVGLCSRGWASSRSRRRNPPGCRRPARCRDRRQQHRICPPALGRRGDLLSGEHQQPSSTGSSPVPRRARIRPGVESVDRSNRGRRSRRWRNDPVIRTIWIAHRRAARRQRPRRRRNGAHRSTIDRASIELGGDARFNPIDWSGRSSVRNGPRLPRIASFPAQRPSAAPSTFPRTHPTNGSSSTSEMARRSGGKRCPVERCAAIHSPR